MLILVSTSRNLLAFFSPADNAVNSQSRTLVLVFGIIDQGALILAALCACGTAQKSVAKPEFCMLKNR
jgi:hypothetical protein